MSYYRREIVTVILQPLVSGCMTSRIAPSRAVRAALLCCVSAVVFALGAFAAEPQKKSFDVPAGPAPAALKQFISQSGVQLLYVPGEVKDVQTKAVKGEFTPAEAIDVLLADTGLVSHVADTGAISVSRAIDPNVARAIAQKNKSDRPQKTNPARGDDNPDRDLIQLDTFEVFGRKTLNMDIRRTRDDAQPYVTFERDSLERSGSHNLEDFLKDRLTMNTQAGTATQSFGGGTGSASYINLRGLGAGQTLILIDGRRAPARFDVFGTSAQPDLNGLPVAAIERVEVLPTTASGIYGGSAVGGVVNVILRRDFSGAEVKTTYSNAFDTDVSSRRVDIGAGLSLNDGKTSVLVALSAADSSVLLMRDREFMRDYRLRVVANNGGNPESVARGTNPPLGSTPNIRSVSGNNLVLKSGAALNAPRTFVPVGYGGISTDGGAALAANAGRYNLDLSPGNGSSAGGLGVYNTPQLRSGALTIRHEIATSIEGYIDLSSSTLTSRTPFGATEGLYTLAASSSSNPFTEAIRISVPLPNESQEMLNRTINRKIAGGLVIGLPQDWKANLDYVWGQSFGNYRAATALPAGLTTAVTTGALDVLRDTSTNPIVVTNYGNYFYQGDIQPPRLVNQIGTLRVAGPLFTAPAGQIVLSGSYAFNDQRTSDGLIASSETNPVVLIPSRSQTIHSGYAELKLPLVAPHHAVPLVKELELQIAMRLDEYTTNGTASVNNPSPATVVLRSTNKVRSLDPTVALKWQPFSGVVLRSSYGTGFLPPNVNSLIRRVDSQQAIFVDPRRGSTTTNLPVGQVASGGNPALSPEVSESWSSGLVIKPALFKGLRVSLDYSNIKKSDAFASLTSQVVVDNEAFLPGRVVRGPNLPGDAPGWAGPVTFLDISTVNVSRAKIEALDFDISYLIRSNSLGQFDLFASATKLLTLDTQVTPLAPIVNNVGFGAQAPANDFTSPLKVKLTGGITWSKRQWSASWFVRYNDSYLVYSPTANGATRAIQTVNQGNGGKIEAQSFHDVSLLYRWNDNELNGSWRKTLFANSEIALGVRNVFNTKPAFNAANVSLGYYSFYADPRMATYWLSFKKRW